MDEHTVYACYVLLKPKIKIFLLLLVHLFCKCISVCIDVRYIPKDVGVAIDISWNGKVIISQELSGMYVAHRCTSVG